MIGESWNPSFENSKFLIYWQDGSCSDLTDYIDFSSLDIGARCDEAFASGSCRLMGPLEHNIPPYTIAKILNKLYFIQSECTKYQTQPNLYAHNITITELSSVLECLVLGSKAFTRGDHNDKYKTRFIIGNMIGAKYGSSVLQFEGYGTDPVYDELESQDNDYTFGPGTTVYGALTEIFKKINARPMATTVSWHDQDLGFSIYCKPFKLDGETVYTLDQDRITQITQTQNQENYCKYLETESKNVVDRTNTHRDVNLTLRSPIGQRFTWDDTSDTLKLHTSTKIEKVDHFYATGIIKQFVCTRLAGRDFLGNSYSPTLNITTWDYTLPTTPIKIYQFIDQIPNATTKQRFISGLHTYCSMYHIDYDKMINASITIEAFGNEPTYHYANVSSGITYTDKFFVMTTGVLGASTNPDLDTKIDLTNYILEQSQYNAEENKTQPKYAYYTKGSSEIGGVFKKVDQTLWDNFFSYLTGSIRGPMLDVASADWDSKPIEERRVTQTAYISSQQYHIGDIYAPDNLINPDTKGPFYSYWDGENTKAAKFEVLYSSITDPMLVDEKKDTPTNEPSYKPISRSYNNSAPLIDFDKIAPSMEKINSWIGKPDLTIEYDITDLEELPELTNKINGLYLMSYSIKYFMSHALMTLNLCKDYSKIAEVIGVAYQYHATTLATEEIIERPIYRKWTLPDTTINLLNNENCYLLFNFKTNNLGLNDILVKPTILKKDNKLLLYCEAMDQFSWGAKITTYTANNQDFKVTEYVPYANENNTISGSSFDVKLVYLLKPLTADQCDLLPQMPVSSGDFPTYFMTLATKSLKWIYKDQRERLTFTFEIEEEEEE